MADRPCAEKIGKRIQTIRESRELTQAALGAACYVGQAAVSHWETGRYMPARATQFLVADALRVKRSWLFRELAEQEDAA